MPTGGVGVSADEEYLRAWFDARVSCVGMGSKLIKTSFLDDQNYKGMKKHIQNVLNSIAFIRRKEGDQVI